jgi:NAD(P)-dependent dehydrogenase (short-subunit alcohol dehydrogenase family)
MPDHARVALVTGASSGFGALTALRLRALGFHVVGTSRHPPPGSDLIALDVDRDDSVRACVARVLALGPIDVVVNNAGRAMLGACEETTAAEARALFETNLFGVMRVTSAVLPAMRARRRGRIINLGSVSGFVGVPFHGVYAASKHALAGYTEALRHELRPFGIHASLIEPAAHRTAFQMVQPAAPEAVYDAPRGRVEAIIRAQIDHGDDPARVVDAIVRAATHARPRLRYRVGGNATFAALARRILPGGLFERVVRREFQLPSRT